MVEIIKAGTKYEDQRFHINCRRCDSTLGFTGSEVTEGVDIAYIVCPFCDAWVNVDKAQRFD